MIVFLIDNSLILIMKFFILIDSTNSFIFLITFLVHSNDDNNY